MNEKKTHVPNIEGITTTLNEIFTTVSNSPDSLQLYLGEEIVMCLPLFFFRFNRLVLLVDGTFGVGVRSHVRA